MKTAMIHLGYEAGTGESVSIPLKHLCITGQTQESGKTTTLEALITRSELRAVAFITKRGEESFETGRQISPYFEERADWEFIESILEAIMKQRMKFERAWIVRACKGARTLADVQQNVRTLQEKSKRSMDQDLFMLLGEYLQKVVPLVQKLPKSPRMELREGLNVMDLRDYPEELQLLVISSAVRWIHQHDKNVVTIVPEAWKFCPQGRNSPVKSEIRRLIREGAGLKNYIWVDSQDIAGVEKEILRACAVWLLGIQRESNEIERTLAQIPKGTNRPDAGDVPRLRLGEFFACWGEHVKKVYVQPAWMEPLKAMDIALGTPGSRESVQKPEKRGEEMDFKTLYEQEKSGREFAEQRVATLEKQITELERKLEPYLSVAGQHAEKVEKQIPKPSAREYTPQETFDNESLYQAIKKRLMEEAPALVRLLTFKPEIELKIERRVIQMSTESLDGNVAKLLHDGFFDEARGNAETVNELNRRGWKTIAPRMSDAFARFNKMGLLYNESGKYRAVEGAKKQVVAA